MRRQESGREGSERHDRWLSVLDTHDVQFLILDARRDRDLYKAVRTNPAWTLDFRDGDTLLFARTEWRQALLAA